MTVNRRSQPDRSAATRAALVAAARPLFADAGFAAVGTETIVRAAGVTRGALYHQFADKTELFAAVYEAVEEDIARQLAEQLSSGAATDPIEIMRLGAEAWLDACSEREVQQIVLLDAPSVLGWRRWRKIGMRYGLGLLEGLLTHAIAVGRIPEQPVSALAQVLVGALDEAALYIALADDQIAARSDMGVVVTRLITQLADA